MKSKQDLIWHFRKKSLINICEQTTAHCSLQMEIHKSLNKHNLGISHKLLQLD